MNLVITAVKDEDLETLKTFISNIPKNITVLPIINGTRNQLNLAAENLFKANSIPFVTHYQPITDNNPLRFLRYIALKSIAIPKNTVVGFLDADCYYDANIEEAFDEVRRTGQMAILDNNYLTTPEANKKLKDRETELWEAFKEAGSKYWFAKLRIVQILVPAEFITEAFAAEMDPGPAFMTILINARKDLCPLWLPHKVHISFRMSDRVKSGMKPDVICSTSRVFNWDPLLGKEQLKYLIQHKLIANNFYAHRDALLYPHQSADVIINRHKNLSLNLLFIVVSSKATRARQDNHRLTWVRGLPKNFRVLFVEGGTEEYIENDILHLACDDTYSGLVNKTEAIHKWASRQSFDYLIKLDDDVVFSVANLIKMNFTKIKYMGSISEVFGNVEGMTVIFSKETVDLIASKPFDLSSTRKVTLPGQERYKETPVLVNAEDNFVFHHLKQFGVEPQHTKNVRPWTNASESFDVIREWAINSKDYFISCSPVTNPRDYYSIFSIGTPGFPERPKAYWVWITEEQDIPFSVFASITSFMKHNAWAQPVLVLEKELKGALVSALVELGVKVIIYTTNLSIITNVKHRSDIIRFDLLSRTGGMYFDHDTITIKSFLQLYMAAENRLIFSSSGEAFEFSIGCLISPKPGNKFLQYMISNYEHYTPMANYTSIIEPTQKYIRLKQLPEPNEEQKELLDSLMEVSSKYFYPFWWNNAKSVYDRKTIKASLFSKTVQIHLYSSIINISETNESNWMTQKSTYAEAYRLAMTGSTEPLV